MDSKEEIQTLCRQAKKAAHHLANMSDEQKNRALNAMADELISHQDWLLEQNAKDLKQAKSKQLSTALVDRLTLTDSRIKSMADGLRQIALLTDPVGKVLESTTQPNGLTIKRVSVPLGVLAVIYESRPNVTADAAALALKSGNAVILRGGSESRYSSAAIVECLHQGLLKAGLSLDSVQMVPTQDRSAVDVLIQQQGLVDVIIPRGGRALIEYLSNNSSIPLFKHLDGICHSYIHCQADVSKTIDAVVNAKMRRPGICGATETLLVDKQLMHTLLPRVIQALEKAGCQLRVDADIYQEYPNLTLASETDWSTEYLDSIVSIKMVNDIDQAIEHIQCYSSAHTDAIFTEDETIAQRFLNEVDSAIVMHNTSTQFADGGEFGMGAEIGISTGKLHARGPVGINQLTTFKYQVSSDYCVRP